MTSTSTERFVSTEADRYEQYRTLSFSAIVALVFGVISIPTALAASLNPLLLIFPFFGMLIGGYSVTRLRRRTDEFTGLGLAKAGLMLSTILLFAGAGYASFVYVTEVPEGFQRISFSDLQPDPRYPNLRYSPLAEELSGKKVFVKGYVYPDDQLGDIKQFILVPDFGACCFGGQPKITDMVRVTLDDPHRVKYSLMRRSLAGEFQLGYATAEKVGDVLYHLDASYVK